MQSFSPAEDVSTIISILPVGIPNYPEKKPGLIPGEYTIPLVKDPNKEVAVLHVARAAFPVYIDENRPSLIVPEPSDRVCASIVRDYVTTLAGYEPGIAEPGLAWVRGPVKVVEIEKQMVTELQTMRELQAAWFKNLVAQADDDWGRYHMRRMISNLQKIAARHLNLDRDWNIDIEIERQSDIDMTPCKFCRSAVHHEAIVCPHCQGILNMKRYQTEFVSAGSMHATAKSSPGEQLDSLK